MISATLSMLVLNLPIPAKLLKELPTFNQKLNWEFIVFFC